MIINDYQSLTGTYAGGVFPSYLRRLSSCKDLPLCEHPSSFEEVYNFPSPISLY
jgi:hypothetical protein